VQEHLLESSRDDTIRKHLVVLRRRQSTTRRIRHAVDVTGSTTAAKVQGLQWLS
jgi:hypothetical protein